MAKCAILSAFYYIGDSGFTYKKVPDFVNKVNDMNDNLEFCSVAVLTERLNNINTRLMDRQSLSLEAAIKIAEDEKFFNRLKKSELNIIAGSYSSSIYPTASFNLSTKEKGANFVNATEFTNTFGNAAVSRACIWNDFRGEAHAISEGLNSGLDAVVDACTNIKYKSTDAVLACATEEVGSAVVLICKENNVDFSEKPIAYIENYDSNYVGDIIEFENYFNKLEDKFKIKLKDTDIYLSGNLDRVTNLSLLSNLKIKTLINKNMLSLNPLIDIGMSLYNYENGAKRDSLIFCIDTKGFVSSVLIKKGGY